MEKERVYATDRRNAALFELDKVIYEGILTTYIFKNKLGDFERILNSHTHKHFVDYLIREKVVEGTKMLITINESNTVEYGEVVDA
jgi:hypothetical protein